MTTIKRYEENPGEGKPPSFLKNRVPAEKQGPSATVHRVGQKNRVNHSNDVCAYPLRRHNVYVSSPSETKRNLITTLLCIFKQEAQHDRSNC